MQRYDKGEIDTEYVNRYTKFVETYQEQIVADLSKSFFEFSRAYDPFFIEYLRLRFEYKDKTESELLELFTDSVRQGNVNVAYPEGF